MASRYAREAVSVGWMRVVDRGLAAALAAKGEGRAENQQAGQHGEGAGLGNGRCPGLAGKTGITASEGEDLRPTGHSRGDPEGRLRAGRVGHSGAMISNAMRLSILCLMW